MERTRTAGRGLGVTSLLLASLVLAGCGGRPRETAAIAFEAAGEGFLSDQATYYVHVRPDGVFKFTPHPAAGAGDAPGTRAGGGSCTIETVSIRRDAHDLVARSASIRTSDRGGLAIDRGAVAEHLDLLNDGVEQSWSFDRKPPGAGGLEIRLRVDGVVFRGQAQGDVHFVDTTTGLGIRYGQAV